MSDGLEIFCKKLISDELTLEEVKKEAAANFDVYRVYPESINYIKGCYFFLIKQKKQKKLVAIEIEKEASAITRDFEEESTFQINGKKVKLMPLNHRNAVALRKYFPFTAPVNFGKKGMSVGLGDRLGLASPGHLRIIKKTGVRPVLAQQSIREITLTGRTFEDVLDAASWAVFQEGYRQGFAADGDHLKTEEEVRKALDLGFSMITLDCSEKIDNAVSALTQEEVDEKYNSLPQEYRQQMEKTYLDREFEAGDVRISFNRQTLQRLVLIYGGALSFTKHIFFDVVKPAGREVDFEVSIDETQTPTTPEAHYFVASELYRMKVDVTSLAPRFCGEFQKAVDYIGDIAQFEREFIIHAKIADHFGYRLSIHSGSDKFRVFPIIGKYTKGRVHVKTAGTNWLEALKVIAWKKPEVFRRIFVFALEHFNEARKYYHVTANLANLPEITAVDDKELAEVLTHSDARQVLHITFGQILTAKDGTGKYLFKDDIYDILHEYEECYYEALENHIGKHIRLLQGK
ncbi:tagaturonate epimerase family protein [Thermoanaerobacterium sp. DL9XJH110]|uniref:tagaturonate epimerase family protein n=1 Tax=Thermoanaerobacterium sp. DL9XJH110 TaxID=3386643 RepID=UPI003BB60C3D